MLLVEPLGILFRTNGSTNYPTLWPRNPGREFRRRYWLTDRGADNRQFLSPCEIGLRQFDVLTQPLSDAIGQGMILIAIFGAASGTVNNSLGVMRDAVLKKI